MVSKVTTKDLICLSELLVFQFKHALVWVLIDGEGVDSTPQQFTELVY